MGSLSFMHVASVFVPSHMSFFFDTFREAAYILHYFGFYGVIALTACIILHLLF